MRTGGEWDGCCDGSDGYLYLDTYSHGLIGECRCERYRETRLRCKAPIGFPPVLQLPAAAAAALPSAVAFSAFKDLCLFGNGELPKLVQLNNVKITVCLSFPLPIPRPVFQ